MHELREPPTSEEIGFRRLNEALVNGRAALLTIFSGVYEDHSGCALVRRRWEYKIRKVPPNSGGTVAGRQIISGTYSEGSPLAAEAIKTLAVLLPVDACCSRREDALKARGPFFLPAGARALPKRPPAFEPPPP